MTLNDLANWTDEDLDAYLENLQIILAQIKPMVEEKHENLPTKFLKETLHRNDAETQEETKKIPHQISEADPIDINEKLFTKFKTMEKEQEAAELMKQKEDLESNSKGYEEQISSLNKTIKQLEKDTKASKKEFATSKAKWEATQNALDQKSALVDKLKDDLGNKELELEFVKEDLQNKKEELEDIATDLDIKEVSFRNELQELKEKHRTEVKDLGSTISVLERENEALRRSKYELENFVSLKKEHIIQKKGYTKSIKMMNEIMDSGLIRKWNGETSFVENDVLRMGPNIGDSDPRPPANLWGKSNE